MEPCARTSLDLEADQWALSTSMGYSSVHHRHSPSYGREDKDQFLKSFITVCKNQLKIGLYKHALFSLESIAQNAYLSHKAVSTASETINSCDQLQKATKLYDLQAVHFNFFVLSAVAALYLAVRHAPRKFSNTPEDIFRGLEILRPYCSSGRLHERVQALEVAMKRLGYDAMGIGPQLTLLGDETLYAGYSDWSAATEEEEGYIAFIPRLVSFPSLRSQAQTAEICNDGAWIDNLTPEWETWGDQERIS
jgi:hypothetical protein